MHKMTRKVLSLALALALCLALLPAAALAAGQEYYPKTGAELEKLFQWDDETSLPSGSVVYLEAKTYQISTPLWLVDENRLTIIGLDGTQIILTSGTDTVMFIENCRDLTLGNLIMGHSKAEFPGGCSEGVLNASGSDLLMMDCELFGCGVYGASVGNSTLTMDHCTIRDCSWDAMSLDNTPATVKNCAFSGNGYSEKYRSETAFSFSGDGADGQGYEVSFTGCTFTGNENGAFYRADPLVSVTTTNCTFSGNGWDKAGSLAYASTQNVLLDGKTVEFQAYALKDASGNDTNYVKLRDVAYALNGTAAQFSVGWDPAAKSISVTSGEAYEPNNTEMKTPYSGNRAYTASSSPLYINGKAADPEAILLTDDAGSGYTYFKLRDLGQLLNFNVTWNGSSIVVESDKPYTG